MPKVFLAAVLAAGVGLMTIPNVSAAPAAGAPIAIAMDQATAVITVAGGCGPGRHPGPRGHCHRNVPEPRSQSR